MSKAKVLEELKRRAESGIDGLAMDFASRMQGKSSAIGAGTLATGGLLASDDSEASFIGAAAKTWNKGAEALAKKMTSEGASRDEIWQATGQMGSPTFKDVDGRWKQEISDQGFNLKYQDDMAKVKELENNLGKTLREKGFDSQEFKDVRLLTQPLVEALSDPYRGLSSKPIKNLLDNNELFNAYPNMKNIQASYELNDSAIPSASYNPNLDSIKAVGDLDSIKYSTGHELQHAIQEREGFAKGGSPGMFAGEFAANRARLNFLEKDPETQRVLAEYDKKQDEIIMSDLEDPSQALEELRYEYMSNPYFKEHEKVMRTLRGKTESGVREYRRLAGEAEARNVEARLNYDMDKRVQNPPWNTLDVPEDELIVRGNKIAEIGAGIAATSTLPWMAKRAEAAEQERISAQIDESIGNMSRGQTIEAPINPYYQTAADALGRYNQALSGSPAEYLLGAEDLENYFRKGAYGEAGLGDAAMGALNIGEAFAAPLEGIRYLGKITNK